MQGDFAIKLTKFIEAEEMTGFVALVKRKIDSTERYVIHIIIKFHNY